ncbi:MAG: hypothetical protein ACI83P_001367 [Janthinobacterium sp.]|jgi:hypothetical protein
MKNADIASPFIARADLAVFIAQLAASARGIKVGIVSLEA